MSQHLSASIQGTLVEFSDETLAKTADIAKIRKLYKLGGSGDDGNKGKRRRKDGSEEGGESNPTDGVRDKDSDGGAERERKELEVAILGLMALRGAV